MIYSCGSLRDKNDPSNKPFSFRMIIRTQLELFIAQFLDVNPLDTANKPVYFVIIHGAEHVDYILEFEIVSNVRAEPRRKL